MPLSCRSRKCWPFWCCLIWGKLGLPFYDLVVQWLWLWFGLSELGLRSPQLCLRWGEYRLEVKPTMQPRSLILLPSSHPLHQLHHLLLIPRCSDSLQDAGIQDLRLQCLGEDIWRIIQYLYALLAPILPCRCSPLIGPETTRRGCSYPREDRIGCKLCFRRNINSIFWALFRKKWINIPFTLPTPLRRPQILLSHTITTPLRHHHHLLHTLLFIPVYISSAYLRGFGMTVLQMCDWSFSGSFRRWLLGRVLVLNKSLLVITVFLHEVKFIIQLHLRKLWRKLRICAHFRLECIQGTILLPDNWLWHLMPTWVKHSYFFNKLTPLPLLLPLNIFIFRPIQLNNISSSQFFLKAASDSLATLLF